MANKLKIEFLDDGSIRVNSREMKGSAAAIKKELEALASAAGGSLEIEAHEPGKHTHLHDDEKQHSHN